MGACEFVMIGVRNNMGVYGILSVIEQRKYIEVYN